MSLVTIKIPPRSHGVISPDGGSSLHGERSRANSVWSSANFDQLDRERDDELDFAALDDFLADMVSPQPSPFPTGANASASLSVNGGPCRADDAYFVACEVLRVRLTRRRRS